MTSAATGTKAAGRCGTVWILSELYHPEETSTGWIKTGIAEGLAGRFDVKVLCGQPTYAARGTRAPVHEWRGGVEIHRCASSTLDKNRLLPRALNALSLSASIFGQALRRFQRRDVVVVVTNPPALPFLAALACWIRGTPCVLVILPSRMYNILAAGRPMIAMMDASTEVAAVIEEEGVGWVVPTGDVERPVAVIAQARSDPAALGEMGRRARCAAEDKNALASVVAQYAQVVEECWALQHAEA